MSKYDYYYSDEDESLDENNENNFIDLDEENDRLLNNYSKFMIYLRENNYSILNKLSFNNYVDYLE